MDDDLLNKSYVNTFLNFVTRFLLYSTTNVKSNTEPIGDQIIFIKSCILRTLYTVYWSYEYMH
jgi:hypothetical protein